MGTSHNVTLFVGVELQGEMLEMCTMEMTRVDWYCPEGHVPQVGDKFCAECGSGLQVSRVDYDEPDVYGFWEDQYDFNVTCCDGRWFVGQELEGAADVSRDGEEVMIHDHHRAHTYGNYMVKLLKEIGVKKIPPIRTYLLSWKS